MQTEDFVLDAARLMGNAYNIFKNTLGANNKETYRAKMDWMALEAKVEEKARKRALDLVRLTAKKEEKAVIESSVKEASELSNGGVNVVGEQLPCRPRH